ncbi:hypothetical protein PFISCL1PPCAC_10997, partial [Pristionchus fissidentatus]
EDEEEEEETVIDLPVDQWDAVKAPARGDFEPVTLPIYEDDGWGELDVASTPPREISSEGTRSETWSESSTHSVNGGGGSGNYPMLSRQLYPVIDDKYMEYYEFLSDGFSKLLKDIHAHRMSLPQWMLNAGDAKRGADLEKPDRFGFCRSRKSSRAAGDCKVASSLPLFECGEKSGLGCAALKPALYYQYNPGPEIYSRKVFVGGLPVDVDEEELLSTFSSFGPLSIDWPNKQLNSHGSPDKSFPPKGYVFLIFQYEMSVRKLVDSCHSEEEKLFFSISSPMNPQKLVQIRPWKLADADYIVDVNMPINPRRVIFVGGVPRPIRAVELAHIMDKLYGSVVCAGIDTDLEYKYPKG